MAVLLLDEGQAVGALVHRRVALVRADSHVVERAVVLAVAVVAAGDDVTFNCLVCLVCKIHSKDLLFGLQQ